MYLHCNASGYLVEASGQPILNWRSIHMSARIGIRLADGTDTTLERLHKDAYTSKLFVDSEHQYVLKASKPHLVTMQRELCVYRYLQQRGVDWIPTVLCIDNPYDPKGFVMTHSGEQVTSANLPHDYREQFLRIANEMAAADVTHNDLKYEVRDLINFTLPTRTRQRVWAYKFLEIFVKHGRLGLVDFNMAKINNSYNCRDAFSNLQGSRAPKKSHRKSAEHRQPDVHALRALVDLHNRSLLSFSDAPTNRAMALERSEEKAELHLIIIWTTSHRGAAAVYREAVRMFGRELTGVRMLPAYRNRAERIRHLNAFYESTRHGKNVDDVRGTEPFAILFVNLARSTYGHCMGGASARGKNTCPPVNPFKIRMRQLHRGLVIHATDSPDEVRENLQVLQLNLSEQEMGLLPRPTWSSTLQMLKALNGRCRYVVQRDFEGWRRQRAPPDEIDLLTDSYSTVVTTLGGLPATAPWTMVGLGGARVRNYVLVARRFVSIDVRFVGDGYYDGNWSVAVLRRRTLVPPALQVDGLAYYIPAPQDLFLMLLYHSLVHKRTFEHRNDLTQMIRELPVGKAIRGEYERVVTSGNASAAREALSTYLSLNGYQFTIPTDPTVHFALDSGRHAIPKLDL